MNESMKTALLNEEKVVLEMPASLYEWLRNKVIYKDTLSPLYEYRDLITKHNDCDFDCLKRHYILYSNRESKDNIKLDYKTLKKSKGLYDIRTLDFKIVEANNLDKLNLFYIDGRLCGWRKTKTGGKEIVEIKSESDLMDYNKYDKKFKIFWTVIQGFFAIIAVLTCIAGWLR